MNQNTKLFSDNSKNFNGSIITPVFKTSTFCFESAEEGEQLFKSNDRSKYVYSRFNHPNMEMTEKKISLFDNSDESALFSSGMSAISTTCLTFLKPNDTILYSNPVYGGTNAFFQNILSKFNISSVSFSCGTTDVSEIAELIIQNNIKMIFIETPCNPNMILTSISMFNHIRNELNKDILIVVDNTMAGPIFLKPLNLGADLCLYSATKFLGGHSDIIAGCVSGSNKLIKEIKSYRSIMGPILDPESCWLIQRSLATLELRMNQQYKNTLFILKKLKENKNITNIYYSYDISSKEEEDNVRYSQKYIFNNEYSGGSSIFSLTLNCNKETIFKILNNLKVFKLAVSLGSVESLIQHPSSMTHSSMSLEDKEKYNITDNLIRCSIGLEDPYDISYDLLTSIDKYCT
tara:strand:+ start:1580 stop:2791 length:1212 start_codon:yes stop_codon:yes gene_type:complete